MLIDTHAHVSDAAFNKDRAEVLTRARAAGVEVMVDVGIDVATSRRALAFANQHEGVYASVGIHPHEGDSVDEAAIAELRDLARGNAKVVAIGETGLDFYRNRSSREGQDRGLRLQLDLARELDLPVILHLRSSANAGEGANDAYEAALAVLRESARGMTGVSHCFSGTPAHAKALVDLGFYVSFAGNATYPNAGVLREAAQVVPLDRIVVETDCPYLTPQRNRGQRNEPAYVAQTAEALAQARGMKTGEFAEAVTRNARRLFRLKE